MPGPPSYDDHLLERLNALKKTPLSLSPNPTKYLPPNHQLTNTLTHTSRQTLILKPAPNPETDLSARLRSLRQDSLSKSPSSAPILPHTTSPAHWRSNTTDTEEPDPLLATDEQTLDELLADLGPAEEWALDADDPRAIQKLLDEANSALPSQPTEQSSPGRDGGAGEGPRKDYLTRDLDMTAFALDDDEASAGEGTARDGGGKGKGKGKGGLEEESREVQEIVAKLLDEVNLERANESDDQEEEDKAPERGGKLIAKDEETPLCLPNTPSTVPTPSKADLDFESSMAARFAALKAPTNANSNPLGLPSAPTFAPKDQPVKGAMKKKFTDQEVDSWCVICQDDATVRCVGCDGDLYCAGCWREGHVGPEVGWEERKHRWTKFRKPR
jgi:hypothetical protein